MTFRARIGNTPVKTKKALKEAVAQQLPNLWFENLNFGGFTQDVRMTEFPHNIRVDVVGPDPERDRRWYATVKT
jgi:hypothetical protein